jgi:hypothetical protein
VSGAVAIPLLLCAACALMLVVDTMRMRAERRERRLDDVFDELATDVGGRITADRAEAIERMAQQLTSEGMTILGRERTEGPHGV